MQAQNVKFQNARANQIPLVDNPFSTYNYKYVVTETQPTDAKNEAIWGLVRMGPERPRPTGARCVYQSPSCPGPCAPTAGWLARAAGGGGGVGRGCRPTDW